MSQRLLVIRFSALGDVAMTLPVLRKVLESNLNTEIIFLTQKNFAPLFNHIERLTVVGVDLKAHKGIIGLFRLFKTISETYKIDAVIDLHQVLRSNILNFFFRWKGVRIFSINKDRSAKRAIIQRKKIVQLTHTSERYAACFQKAGLKMQEGPFRFPSIQFDESTHSVTDTFIEGIQPPYIAFAPFAKHATKTLPFEQSTELIQLLSKEYSVFLLGGKDDEAQFEHWTRAISNAYSTTSLTLLQQTCLMEKMQAVISMDSANMHLAAIQGIPVVSIWGATHPCFGFNGIGTSPNGIVQTKNLLACRPCSVFGDKPCKNQAQPLACLRSITTEMIVKSLESINRN